MKQGIENNRIFFFLIMILTASPTFLFSQEMQGKMAENLCSAIRFTMEQPIRLFYTNCLANVKGLDGVSWLNGVKTIDIAHDAGFSTGNIGFQLCHYHSSTSVDIKSLYIRETQ
jgi:hypothetical protein